MLLRARRRRLSAVVAEVAPVSAAGGSTRPVPAPIRVGIIGYGYWGPNLVRNFSDNPGSTVAAVCDLDETRLAQVHARYPSVYTTTDAQDLFADPRLDAVVIATPVAAHFSLAMSALQAQKHVLVEKPLAQSSSEASQLAAMAQQVQRVLLVDHIFVYTAAVRKIRDLVQSNQLGRVYYYDSVRVNLGLFQHDVSVVWDLAVHDLSIMDYVLGVRPHSVSAVGAAHVAGQPVNTAYLTCFFDDNLIAHFHVNWLAPVKIRRTLIGGERQMIVYDDVEPSEKVKVYDRGITLPDADRLSSDSLRNVLIGYRTGDMWAPKLDATEALQREVEHFIGCVRGEQVPLSDAQAGLRVVRILEAASQSVEQSGRSVPVDWDGF